MLIGPWGAEQRANAPWITQPGTQPAISVSPTRRNFSSVVVNIESPPLTVTVHTFAWDLDKILRRRVRRHRGVDLEPARNLIHLKVTDSQSQEATGTTQVQIYAG